MNAFLDLMQTPVSPTVFVLGVLAANAVGWALAFWYVGRKP